MNTKIKPAGETAGHNEHINGEAMPDKNTVQIPKVITGLNDVLKPLPHKIILARLLNHIGEVDFRELAGVEDGDKVPKRDMYVIAVDQVLQCAQQQNWSLCKHNDFIYLYNGSFWRELDRSTMQTFLGEAAEKMGVKRSEARFYDFRDKLMKQFLAVANLPKPEPPAGTVFVNLENGTFEISPKGTRLRPPSEVDFLKYQLPFSYDPDARAPLFQSFLDQVLPDSSCQQVLAEYVGYCFVPHSELKAEKALLLYGGGANGKSVFFEIVTKLLGAENVSNYDLRSLTDEAGYHRAALANKLVNYASEMNGRLEAATFKQLVSGEPIQARLPYGQPFNLTNPAKLMFNCNELPRDTEQTHAYFRRFIIVPFLVTIPNEQQDKHLADKIVKDELSGVFNWVLDGLRRLLANQQFTHSEAINNQLDVFRTQSDSVKMFLAESGFEPDKTESNAVPASEVYSKYKIFCSDDNYKPVGKNKFLSRLNAIGVPSIRRSSGWVLFINHASSPMSV